MRTLRPLLPLLLLGVPAVASATVYYSTGFETLTNGQLAGQDSWSSDLGPAANVGELGRLQQLCSFINANGSGFGVCRSCRLGGLGAGRQ